jgi:hypothetical protein
MGSSPEPIFAPIVWELLQHVGAALAGYALRHLSNTYGPLSFGLDTLAWLHRHARRSSTPPR